MRYAQIVFLQDEEGQKIVDALTHTDGAVRHGSTIASVEAVVDYLSEWDNGEYEAPSPRTGAGILDVSTQFDDKILTWNEDLGYVNLLVMVNDDGTPVDVTTCRGCGSPVDYCPDHTHVPSFEDADYSADYDAVSRRIGALNDED